MAEAKIRLRIVTPTKEFFNEDVHMVSMRGIEGDFGVLKGHQPFTTTLDYGFLKIKNDGKEIISTMFGGFVDVQPNIVTILTDEAEWIDEIDMEKAKKAKERAEKRLQQASKSEKEKNIDVKRAELALKRALLRLGAKK